jgi:OOP family OmpA-OmpF porin
MRVKTLILATSAAGALALSAGAASAEPNGWYGAVDAGYHQIGDLDLVSQQTGPELSFDLKDSWAGFARLGYRFTPNWRVELEGGYRNGEIDAVSGGPGGGGLCAMSPSVGACEAPGGNIDATTLMANVIYDFGSADARMRPFIGLGAGVARISTDFNASPAWGRTVGINANDTSTELAAQAIAGLAFAISDRAHLDLTYRYLMTDMDFTSVSTIPSPNYDLGTMAGDYDGSHTVSLGLRFAFGAVEAPYVAPPAPPPAPVVTPPAPRPTPPAPAPVVPAAREFVVYFDWDRSDLTAEASSVVTQAANYAKSGRPTRILVVGHADTSGSAAYNVGLSNRRARTVGDALVAQGVNGGVISLDGKGETALARATADGVREPLNRRATIGINFQ